MQAERARGYHKATTVFAVHTHDGGVEMATQRNNNAHIQTSDLDYRAHEVRITEDNHGGRCQTGDGLSTFQYVDSDGYKISQRMKVSKHPRAGGWRARF